MDFDDSDEDLVLPNTDYDNVSEIMRMVESLNEEDRVRMFKTMRDALLPCSDSPLLDSGDEDVPTNEAIISLSSDEDIVEDDDDGIDVEMVSKEETWVPSESSEDEEDAHEPYDYSSSEMEASSEEDVAYEDRDYEEGDENRTAIEAPSPRKRNRVEEDPILPDRKRRRTRAQDVSTVEIIKNELHEEFDAPVPPVRTKGVFLIAVLRPQQEEGVTYIIDAEKAFLEVFQENKKLTGVTTSAGEQVELKEQARGVVMADDMGKGKTIQLLEVIRRTLWCSYENYGDPEDLSARKHRRTLMIVPKAAVQVWVKQAKEHFEGFNVIAFDPAKTTNREIRDAHVVVINYAKLVSQFKNETTSKIYTWKWWRVVLDESHNIRNEGTRKLKAVNALRPKSVMRHTVSGTPEQNKPLDLYTTFAFIDAPGTGKAVDWTGGTHLWCYSKCVELLAAHMIRRDDTTDLPPLNIFRKTLRMSKQESELYASVYSELEDKVVNYEDVEGATERRSARAQILKVLSNLRTICVYPALYDPSLATEEWASTGCTKFRGASEDWDKIVADDPTAGILIFSQFSTALIAMAPWFERVKKVKSFLFTGKTSQKERDYVVNAFQNDYPDVPVALFISTGAGGTGLTLTRATYEIFLDWEYNPKVTDQAIKRAHRIGQTKAVRVILFESVAVDHTGKVEGDKALETIECGIRLRCDYKRNVFDCLMKGVRETDKSAQASLTGLSRSIFENTDGSDGADEKQCYLDKNYSMRNGEWKAAAPVYTRGAYGSTASAATTASDKSLDSMDGIRNMVDQGRHTIREVDEEEQQRIQTQRLLDYRQRVTDMMMTASAKPGCLSGVTFTISEIASTNLLVEDMLVYSMVVERHGKLFSPTTYYVNFTQLCVEATNTSFRMLEQANGTLRRNYLYPNIAAIYKNWDEKEDRVRDFEMCCISVTAFRVTGDIDFSLLSNTTVSSTAEFTVTGMPQPRISFYNNTRNGTGTLYYLLDDATANKLEPCGQFELSMDELTRYAHPAATDNSSMSPFPIRHESNMFYSHAEIQQSLSLLGDVPALTDRKTLLTTTARFVAMCSRRRNDDVVSKGLYSLCDILSSGTAVHSCFSAPPNNDCIVKIDVGETLKSMKGTHIFKTSNDAFVVFNATDTDSCPKNSQIAITIVTASSCTRKDLSEFITAWMKIAYAKGRVSIATTGSTVTFNRRQRIKFIVAKPAEQTNEADLRGKTLLMAIARAKKAWKATSPIKVEVEINPWKDTTKSIDFI